MGTTHIRGQAEYELHVGFYCSDYNEIHTRIKRAVLFQPNGVSDMSALIGNPEL